MAPRVLIVDDSMMIRQHVGRALGQAGFEVVEAKDGLDALEKLAQGKPVALVVCDVNMPRMSGLEFLESVQANASLAGLSVVMLTTEGNSDLVRRAKALGAKAWILKPFKPDLLVAAVKKLTSAAA
jgi:two-component system, chemotaxis family, chemotaxis protein CheY